MSSSDRGQVIHNAAEVYEEFFVPALFEEWTHRVAEAVQIRPGQRVLDVACGTGILARHIAERVKPTGSVVGLDINEGMLAVARHKAPQIEWRQGQAEHLPFDDNSFDAVVSQFALMFFEDRRAALREMVRVLRPGGHLAIAVWDALEHSPGYVAMARLLARLFGEEVANSLYAPFNLGNVETLRVLLDGAGIADATISTHEGTARFPSLEAWVYTEIKGWVLADVLDDEQFELLLREAKQELTPFVTAEGEVVFSDPAHIITATKR